MSGKDGDDTLVWNNGDGNDTMNGGDGIDTIESNGADTGSAAVDETYTAETAGKRFLFKRILDGPVHARRGRRGEVREQPQGRHGQVLHARPDPARDGHRRDADGGEGDDELKGTDGADTLTGGPGNDKPTGFKATTPRTAKTATT